MEIIGQATRRTKGSEISGSGQAFALWSNVSKCTFVGVITATGPQAGAITGLTRKAVDLTIGKGIESTRPASYVARTVAPLHTLHEKTRGHNSLKQAGASLGMFVFRSDFRMAGIHLGDVTADFFPSKGNPRTVFEPNDRSYIGYHALKGVNADPKLYTPSEDFEADGYLLVGSADLWENHPTNRAYMAYTLSSQDKTVGEKADAIIERCTSHELSSALALVQLQK